MSFLLTQGTSGQNVRLLQELLNFRQVANPPLVVDGMFGPKTRAAVVKFQKSANLAADGVVGPMTGQTLVANVFVTLLQG